MDITLDALFYGVYLQSTTYIPSIFIESLSIGHETPSPTISYKLFIQSYIKIAKPAHTSLFRTVTNPLLRFDAYLSIFFQVSPKIITILLFSKSIITLNRVQYQIIPTLQIKTPPNNQYQQIHTTNMFYQFSFQTQANLDDDFQDYQPSKIQNLPTTTHNSPGSVKSASSFNLELDHLSECSIELGTQINHANNIKDASLMLLSSCITGTTDIDNGFNTESLYRYSGMCEESKTIEEALKGNRLLRYREKVNFLEELQKSSQLCGLITELMMLFNPRIFGELLYVIHTVWNKKYLNYRQRQINSSQPIISSFSAFWGMAGEEVSVDQVDVHQRKDTRKISAAAVEGLQNIARELFNSKKLKYLNFQDVQGEKAGNRILKQQFQIFVGAVAKAVFLSAEGIYEQEANIPIFSEEEEEEDISQLPMEGAYRFVRAYSQISQEDDCELTIQTGSKRRKLE